MKDFIEKMRRLRAEGKLDLDNLKRGPHDCEWGAICGNKKVPGQKQCAACHARLSFAVEKLVGDVVQEIEEKDPADWWKRE